VDCKPRGTNGSNASTPSAVAFIEKSLFLPPRGRGRLEKAPMGLLG